jgi:cytochrome c553
MKILALAVLAAVAIGAVASAQDMRRTSMAKITATCQSCHGVGGNSRLRNVPRLNGQIADYLAARLAAFRDPTKQTPNAVHPMWSVANAIGDDEIPRIAKYYAAQTPTPRAHRKSAPARQGAYLFAQGAPDVPACGSCHGAQGEGTKNGPRLAGQHRDYLSYQMTAFVVTMRYKPTMDHVPMKLTQTQIAALAAYLGKD